LKANAISLYRSQQQLFPSKVWGTFRNNKKHSKEFANNLKRVREQFFEFLMNGFLTIANRLEIFGEYAGIL